MHKYKVGESVRIKDDADVGSNYNLRGQVFPIEKLDGLSYHSVPKYRLSTKPGDMSLFFETELASASESIDNKVANEMDVEELLLALSTFVDDVKVRVAGLGYVNRVIVEYGEVVLVTAPE